MVRPHWLRALVLCCMGALGTVVALSTFADSSSAVEVTWVASASYRPRSTAAPIRISDADREGHALMLRVLESLRKRESETNEFWGTANVTAARQQYEQAVTDQDCLTTGLRLTFAELDQGNEETALELIGQMQALAAKIGDRILPDSVVQVHFLAALVHLRHGETQNCCLAHNKDSCLLPIRGGGLHADQAGSRAAIAEFRQVAELSPRTSDRYLEAVWLWNIAAMTLDEHPDGVPEEHRIPREAYFSKEKFPRFFNIAAKLGLNVDSMCGSVIAEDFNNDGWLDLMVSTWDLREPLKFYLNDGAGAFVDRTSEASLDGMAGGLNMIQGDYNNDGRIDVYIFRGAWLFANGRHAASLLRNNGDGTFTDVTFPAGLAQESYPAQTGGWADYDLDGWLDLFVAGEEGPSNRAPCRLFHNNRDGTFTDVALKAGVATHQTVKGCTWGDYNNDRYPDLYVSNLSGAYVPGDSTKVGSANRLYRNNGDGTFTDVARAAGVVDENSTFGAWFWDYNNDGVLDLYVATYSSTTGEIARYYRGEKFNVGMPRVYRGSATGKFDDVTAALGLEEPTLPMGSNFGDLDNDGWLDMYIGTGRPDYQFIVPNKLYHNIGGQRFADVSEAAGMAHLQKGHGVAVADLDADGDQDVFMQMGGATPVDKYLDALFENPGFGNNSLAVELAGVESNRFGVGSRIRVDIEEGGRTRSIYRWVNSGGSFGCNSLRQHIGVGKATIVKRLEVFWPTTGATQTFDNVPTGAIVRVTEGSPDLLPMKLRPTVFAVGPRPKTTAAAGE
jgi:hypothetical protein